MTSSYQEISTTAVAAASADLHNNTNNIIISNKILLLLLIIIIRRRRRRRNWNKCVAYSKFITLLSFNDHEFDSTHSWILPSLWDTLYIFLPRKRPSDSVSCSIKSLNQQFTDERFPVRPSCHVTLVSIKS